LGMFHAQVLSGDQPSPGQEVSILFKPTALEATPQEPCYENMIEGVVVDSVFRGEYQSIQLRCQSEDIFQFHVRHSVKTGDRVKLCLPDDGIICLRG